MLACRYPETICGVGRRVVWELLTGGRRGRRNVVLAVTSPVGSPPYPHPISSEGAPGGGERAHETKGRSNVRTENFGRGQRAGDRPCRSAPCPLACPGADK